ncbi:hypothetical protein [Jeongeupia naejangsanensis]|uniref:Uncharacterized protein n=1 Tax=Jeongeupia naejangsanensis TaxID=613195 RepID=A0ABS2BQG8_9NEIS|nr:hypothetical protein [Jeongeupia naejangsanensis]MBM3117884.1 hypothetical protein [Jeongeupia naejangsanensis]
MLETRSFAALTELTDLTLGTLDEAIGLLHALEAIPDHAGRHMRTLARNARFQLQGLHNDVDCQRAALAAREPLHA